MRNTPHPDRAAISSQEWLRCTLVVLLLLALPIREAPGQPTEYRLGKGDVVQIYVLGEEDLSVQVKVTDDGNIFYPLLGEIEVEGMTPDELERTITQLLKGPYLIDPRVTASMLKYRQYFIEGEVENPGGYAYVPGLTIRQAITNAGGFTDLASRSRIYLVHEKAPEESRKKVTPNDPVSPGDTITIQESFF